MIQPEELVGGERAEWYRLTPAQRWLESEKLRQIYLALGGLPDPEGITLELDLGSPLLRAFVFNGDFVFQFDGFCFRGGKGYV